MKLHLPLSLFRRLTYLMAAAACVTVASAEVMKTQHASLLTYADFGQNMGRYVTGTNVNGLLQHIRTQDKGVLITYTDGTASNVLEHGMIDFSSVVQGGGGIGAGNLVAPNAYITAQHNGTFSPSFSSTNVVGEGNAIRYQGIEYRNSAFEIRSNSTMDIKITRLNKLVTDAAPAAVYGGSLSRDALLGQTVYHSGAGRQYVYNEEAGALWWQANPGTFITGGATELNGSDVGNTAYTVGTVVSIADPAVSAQAPLPYQPQDGDSGSPLFIWDEGANQFAYIGSYSSVNSLVATGGNTTYSKAIFDPQAMGNLAAFTDTFTPADGHHVFDIMSTNNKGAQTSGTVTINEVSYTCTANAYNAPIWDMDASKYGADSGARFNHLDTSKDVYTWAALNAEKDKDNWFHYGSEYMNATQDVSSKTLRTWGELYASRDNRIVATDGDDYQIRFTGLVDTGLGTMQLSKAEGVESASFVFGPRSYLYASAQLLTSGYIVDKDVTLHLQFTNPENYVREWRKVGEGTLSIEGEGNNWVLLNVGGPGKTELNRENGFAAYNVLANTGSTVVINGINQIARDFTFGNGGAVLDFNGNSMTWNNSAAVADDGFTIHALTQAALITNNAETAVTLTVTDGGEKFLGSFSDAGTGALTVDFQGSAWELNSIHTDLKHHDGSGLVVSSGDVTLAGVNTQHAAGTLEPGKTDAYSNADDWHYSDAAMNVTVKDGGTFELGSHARLSGDVTVKEGGTYIMHEGVKHAQEYVEGGQVLEDTAQYSDFYGHKGDVVLEGGTMKAQLSEGTDTDMHYAGDIKGSGKLVIDAGADGAHVVLEGDNTFVGARIVERGGLIADTAAALGNTASDKWQVKEGAYLSSKSFEGATGAEILRNIHADSAGVIALTEASRSEAIDLSTHTKLGIGALQGHTVEYGTQGTELAAQAGEWHLGGGGGTLQVNASLNGDATLVLGTGNTSGTVVLAGEHNVMNGVAAAEGADMVLRGDFSLNDHGTISTGSTGSLLLEQTAITNLGTSEVSGQVIFGNQVSVSGNLVLTGEVQLQGGLVNNGTLIFRDATLDISNESVEKLGTVYGTGTDAFTHAADGNGFRGEAVSVATERSISGNGEVRMEGNSSMTYAGMAASFTSQQGDTIMAVKSDADKLYYANNGVVTVGGAQASAETNLASGFVVNKDGTLNIAGNASSTLNTSSILLNTTGNGVMQLSTDASIASNTTSKFSGTLEVTNGATLNIGSGAGNGVALANVRPDLYSLSSLVLNGGNLHYGSWGAFWLRDVQVLSDAKIDIDSMGTPSKLGADHFVLQNVHVSNTLDINTKYYSSIQIDKLSGEGTLAMHGSTDAAWANTTNLVIGSLDGFAGSLTMERAMDKTNRGAAVLAQADITAGDKDVHMKNMTFTDGVVASLTVAKELSVEKLDIAKSDHGATSLTVKGGSVHADTMALGEGSLVLSNGAKLSVGDSLTAKAAAGHATATLTGYKVSEGVVHNLDVADTALELVDAVEFNVEHMVMNAASSMSVKGSVINAADSQLCNLSLAADAALIGTNITVSGANSVDVAAAAMPMTLAAAGQATPLVIYSQQLSGVTMAEGATLVLNLDTLLPDVDFSASAYTILFSGLTWETQGDLMANITLQAGDWATERELQFLSATQDESGTYINISLTTQAPEPATATLSLLALAALAARRKRK